MESNNLTPLKSILLQHINLVADQIKQSISKNGIINSGIWTNTTNTIMAYLSYYPNGDLNEDSLDVTIELALTNGNGLFSANICWSNGEIVADVMNINFNISSSEQLFQQVDKFGQLATDKLVDHFKLLLRGSLLK